MIPSDIQAGEIVKYAAPDFGESDFRFILREINEDRALIELICDYAIRPLETVMLTEICPV